MNLNEYENRHKHVIWIVYIKIFFLFGHLIGAQKVVIFVSVAAKPEIVMIHNKYFFAAIKRR
jgi:hypothetical protein